MKLHLILAALVVLSYCSLECQTLSRKKRSGEDIGKLWNELVQEARKTRVALEKYHDNVQKRKIKPSVPDTDDDYDDKTTNSPVQTTETKPTTSTTTTSTTKTSTTTTKKPEDSNATPETNNPKMQEETK